MDVTPAPGPMVEPRPKTTQVPGMSSQKPKGPETSKQFSGDIVSGFPGVCELGAVG